MGLGFGRRERVGFGEMGRIGCVKDVGSWWVLVRWDDGLISC